MKWRLVVGMIDELTGLGINPPPIPRDGTSGDTTTRRRASSHTSFCAVSGLVSFVWVKLLGGWPGLGHLVVCERQLRCPVTRRAARRAERGALDGRRVGAIGVVCARVPMLILVHGLGLAPGRRHDGGGVPAWGRARRPLSLWRPSTRAWRQRNAGSWPRCIGLRRRRARTREAHAGASPSLAEVFEGVVAAFEQLARERQAGAVASEPLGGLQEVVAVRRALAAGGLSGLIQRPAQSGRALAGEVPGRAALVGGVPVMSMPPYRTT